MRKLRVYADTSVFGGCFDDEFATGSLAFFEAVRTGRFILVLSATTLAELGLAPGRVRAMLRTLPAQFVETTEEVEALRDA